MIKSATAMPERHWKIRLTRADMAAFLRDQRSIGCHGREALNVARTLGLYTLPKGN